jgi:hypothetical protein
VGTGEYDDTDREIAKLVPGELAAAQQQLAILDDQNSATVVQLLAGWPMRANSWQVDAAVWAQRVLADQEPPGLPSLPPAVERALRQVMTKPTFGNLTALRKAASRRRPEWSREYNGRLDECVERGDIYLWHLGDESAAGRCVLRALDRITNVARAPIRDGLLRTAIETASGMTYEAVQRQIRNSALHVQMRDRAGTTQSSMSAWIEAWAAHQEKLRAGETEKVLVEEDDEITLVEAVQDDRDRGQWAYAKPVQQTLVVVPSLDHLPKATLTQRDRRDTPRAEFGRIEGVALPLKPVPNALIEILLSLGLRFPWMRHVFDEVGQHLVYSDGAFRLPPLCFAGGPGCGKTSAAIGMLKGFDIPSTVYSAAGVHDGAFAGTSRQWSTGRASVPLQTILKAGVANPVIVLDEIEKSGESRHNGALADVLLSMTEPTSAKAIFDPYLECSVDLSAISFIATANNPNLLSGPLRDRFKVIEIPAPGVEHVPAIAQGLVNEIREKRGAAGAFVEDLAPDEIEILAEGWKPGSMRSLRRRVEILLSGRDRLATRN